MATKCTASAVIAEASKWVGYLEKKTNAQLDSFTGNAGTNNYTRFNRDLISYRQGIGTQPMEWCGAFVSCVFVYAFGLDAALKLLGGKLYCYTPYGAQHFKDMGRYHKRGQTPQPGDVVFFYSSAKGRIGHTGIVERVTSTRVYTIEGNTSGGSTLITNGGGVARKNYALTSTYIDGYGRPDYAGIDSANRDPVTLALGDRILVNGMEGDDVKEMQTALIKLGYSCGKWGADGEFGDATEMAVRHFQTQEDCLVDGEFGPESLAALKKALARLDKPVETPKYVHIVGGNCYVRTEASTAGDIRGVAHEGDKLPYGGQTAANGWQSVVYKDRLGWVSGKYGRLA